MGEADRRVDAVFEGGGIKGIALVGAASVVEEAGYRFHNLSGTSAGAIVATLLGAGYTAGELRAIMTDLDFRQFTDSTTVLGRIPWVGDYFGVLTDLGLYEGDAFLRWMRGLLEAKGVRTFGDLVFPDEDEARYRFRVHAVASDVSRGSMVILPDDAPAYGIEPEALDVALAVRMSMSIPYVFKPVTIKNALGETCYVVDGGLLSNFPIELFDTPPPAVPAWPTFGFVLVPGEQDPRASLRVDYPVRGPLTMLYALFNTAMVAHDAHAMSTPDVSARTIKIDHLDISPIEFGLTAGQKRALYESGRASARAFLADWDFERYKRRFRTADADARRQEALSQPSTSAPSA